MLQVFNFNVKLDPLLVRELRLACQSSCQFVIHDFLAFCGPTLAHLSGQQGGRAPVEVLPPWSLKSSIPGSLPQRAMPGDRLRVRRRCDRRAGNPRRTCDGIVPFYVDRAQKLQD